MAKPPAQLNPLIGSHAVRAYLQAQPNGHFFTSKDVPWDQGEKSRGSISGALKKFTDFGVCKVIAKVGTKNQLYQYELVEKELLELIPTNFRSSAGGKPGRTATQQRVLKENLMDEPLPSGDNLIGSSVKIQDKLKLSLASRILSNFTEFELLSELLRRTQEYYK